MALTVTLGIYWRAPVPLLNDQLIYTPNNSEAERRTGLAAESVVELPDISMFLVLAVLTSEDGNFLMHHGFSVSEMGRAVKASLLRGKRLRGASTISQQLVKNVFLSGSRTVSRKLIEAIYTVKLERYFTKAEILTLYLNVIQFGVSTFGVEEASRSYFGGEPSQLTLEKAALLTFLLPDPVDREPRLRQGRLEAADREDLWIILFRTHAVIDYLRRERVEWRNGLQTLKSISLSGVAEAASVDAPARLISEATRSLGLIETEHCFQSLPAVAEPTEVKIGGHPER